MPAKRKASGSPTNAEEPSSSVAAADSDKKVKPTAPDIKLDPVVAVNEKLELSRTRPNRYIPKAAADQERLDQFRCSICMEVMFSPTVLPCHGHHSFCWVCISGWFAEGKQDCPECRSVISNADQSKIISDVDHTFNYESHPATKVAFRQFISPIKVICSYIRFGCDWSGDVGTFHDHAHYRCLYRPLPCVYCKDYYLRRDMKTHPCPTRPVWCPDCNVQCGNIDALTFHRQLICLERTVTCAEEGKCDWKGKANLLAQHLTVCEQVWVSCTKVGCNVTLRRRHMAQHMIDSELIHSLRETIDKQADVIDTALGCTRCTHRKLYIPHSRPAYCMQRGCNSRSTRICLCDRPVVLCDDHTDYGQHPAQ